MEIKKGDEFLELETGIVYRIYFISRHGEFVLISSRKNGEGDFVLHINERPIGEINRNISSIKWIPNTPAGRTLYGHKG